MADCDPERIMCLWNTHVNEIKLYSSFKCFWLQIANVGLHKICILKKTISKGALFAFWVKIIS